MSPMENDHHLQWNRAEWMSQRIAKKIRQHPGMILHNVYIPTHRSLHREIQPIQIPSHTLAIVRLAHLNTIDLKDARTAAPVHADFLWRLAEMGPGRLGDESALYAQHLEDQIEFLGLRNDTRN